MRILGVVAGVTMLVCTGGVPSVIAQQTEQVAGIWEFTIQENAALPSVDRKAYVLVRQVGDALLFENLHADLGQAKGSAKSSAKSASVEMSGLIFHPKASTKFQWQNDAVFPDTFLKGTVAGEEWSGVVVMNGVQTSFVAHKTASVWSCSNHDRPRHLANSENEMRDYTTKQGCQRWYRITLQSLR